ncbi:MAG: Rrf2 family transcriptional regulator [Chloroflexi bacterium]|nr:Rrf2 family transcriptional regulator [Chloroflexota bacterium]
MHIPVKVDYVVRALVDLAQHTDEGSVRASDIARRQQIPEAFLDRLLHTMSKENFIKSQRGPQGGHSLAMDPKEITLAKVMNVMGGWETLVGCLDDPAACFQSNQCAQRDIWREVDEAVQQILDRTTIAELAQRLAGKAKEPAPSGA